MAVWWPVWPLVLCLICAWSAVGLGLGLGVFWVLAGGVARGGVVAVISGAGLAVALCALVWRVWGAGAGQQMLSGFSAFWRVGRGLGGCGGIGSGGGCCCIIGGGSSGRDSGCIRVWSWLLRLACCGSGMGLGAGWVAGWLQEVACLLYSI